MLRVRKMQQFRVVDSCPPSHLVGHLIHATGSALLHTSDEPVDAIQCPDERCAHSALIDPQTAVESSFLEHGQGAIVP